MRRVEVFLIFLFIYSFGKHHVVRKDLGTYVQLNIDSMSYYCWHHRRGEYVGRRNYKPPSFYVSGWNVLFMCMRWVLAIMKDYMMIEYVDLPKGSDMWPFLERWWIIVAKLTENIVCWFLIEFMLYTSIVWWIVTYSWEVYDKSLMFKFVAVIIIYMMLLCVYFVFIDTSLSLSMWTCFPILVFAWGQARSKLGGVDTSILHHVFLLLFMMFLSIIMHFGVILMPFLS